MKLRTLAVVIVAAGAAAAGGCSSAPAASPLPAASGGPSGYWTQSRLLAATPWREPGYQPGPSASAPPSEPGVQVGALFEHDASGNHFCTASVVASPGLNLLITAAPTSPQNVGCRAGALTHILPADYAPGAGG